MNRIESASNNLKKHYLEKFRRVQAFQKLNQARGAEGISPEAGSAP